MATRYVTPLREGGSLPAVMEADDLGTYVVKFRGAGQGQKALIAEIISAGLARTCDLLVPDLVTVEVDPAMAPGEPDQEIQDLLRASGGLNLGVDFLPGALDFEGGAGTVDAALAGKIMWFDALVGNADRSWRNPNMLLWHGSLYLIDHGATLTFQHRWASAASVAARPYDVSDHALLGCRALVQDADDRLASRLTEAALRSAVQEVPEEWLSAEPGFSDAAALRKAYVAQLRARLDARPAWLPPLVAAAAKGLTAGSQSRRSGPVRARSGQGGGRRGGPGWMADGRGHTVTGKDAP
jgi:hypothetical protein